MSELTQDAVTLAEIRRLIDSLPHLDPVALPQLEAYGHAGEWVAWMARAQGTKPQAERLRLVVYAGAHGCHPQSAEDTRQLIAPLTTAEAPVVRILRQVDADLRVYELDLESATANYTQGPALTEKQAAHAMAYGMMAVEPGLHLLALCGVGAGGDEAHKALISKLAASEDALQTLVQTGGLEVCAMLGAILAARLAKVPVLLDGFAAETAAAVLARLQPEATLHCASAKALEPDLFDKTGLAAALGLVRLKALAALG